MTTGAYFLGSNESLGLLRNALEQAETDMVNVDFSLKTASKNLFPSRAYAEDSSSSSDEQVDTNNCDSSTSSDNNDATDEDDGNKASQVTITSNNVEDDEQAVSCPPSKFPATMQKTRKATVASSNNLAKVEQIIREIGRPPCLSFALGSDLPMLFLDVPASILWKHDRRRMEHDKPYICRSLLQAAEAVMHKPVFVLLLRSGRFAGAVFQGEKCLVHRACQRYTIRRGQGKAQSSQDNSKRKAKSMGAQLRRAGEQNLREDVLCTIKEWQKHLTEACLIFISCPKTMTKNFFEDLNDWLSRDDDRIRDVPLDFGRPTFESVRAVHGALLTLVVREGERQNPSHDTAGVVQEVSLSDTGMIVGQSEIAQQKLPTEASKVEDIIPLSPLHLAAQVGDLTTILEIVDSANFNEEVLANINQPAGNDFMTPLHYATLSSSIVDPATSAACVLALLIQGHADPCLVDIRNRPPYFLATSEKVRDAFRVARARLGEEYCGWDGDAKVGPALTAEGIEARKEKEAEKRRRKKTKQKEKKEKVRIQTEELEHRRQEEEDRRQREEDAKRIRDGLQPRTSSAGNVCDFCQKVCKGKLRHQMFKRLDYAYCSTECVEKHKRELMAAAAMARLTQANKPK